MTGMCVLQGKRGGAPEITYGSVVDYYAAALLAAGVASALFERERSGRGQYVGVSLLRSALAMQSARMVWAEGEALDIGRDMAPAGSRHPSRRARLLYVRNTRPSGAPREDGVGSAGADRAADERAEHAAEIVPLLHQALAAHDAEAWETIFGDEVPSAAARRIEDMFDHPQVQAEGLVTNLPHPVVGSYRGVTQPIHFSRTPGPAPFAAPTLGQHTLK